MIIINLKGGLGNQMFQYAFGRAYSILHDNEMKLDITGYPRQTLRAYSLSAFNIREDIASNDEIQALKYPYGIISKGWRFFKQIVLRQFNFDYHPSLLAPKKDFYFDGFFQTEKYFQNIQGVIRREFTLLESLSPDALEIDQKIKEATIPISLHVRRQDYVTNKKNAKVHDITNSDYYLKAIDTITSGFPEATFFVFSDDIGWVKEHIKIPCSTIYVSKPSIKDVEELTLMSHCTHHIIANSTFSWWGAWLNPNPDKIVIAPKRWTNKTWFYLTSDNHPNIIPSTWTKI